MPSQPPLILVDNVYDRINQYPINVLSSTGDAVGRDKEFVADYRRERTYWQAATVAADRYVGIDTDPGLVTGLLKTVDSLWIDRGHNMWGKDITVYAGDGAVFPDFFGYTVPALGTVGGDPTTGFCVTEEGALYTLWGGYTRRAFIVNSPNVHQPIFTGLILGKRVQLLNYSSVRDEDAGERSQNIEKSRVPGYDGRDRTYARRKLDLKLSAIGAAEYDSSIRSLRRLLFEMDQPAVVIPNYGTHPQRAWLYQYEGSSWSSPMQRVLRDVGLPLYEVGPLVR